MPLPPKFFEVSNLMRSVRVYDLTPLQSAVGTETGTETKPQEIMTRRTRTSHAGTTMLAGVIVTRSETVTGMATGDVGIGGMMRRPTTTATITTATITRGRSGRENGTGTVIGHSRPRGLT